MDTGRNDSKQLALAAVMFFSFMVKGFLENNKSGFSEKEQLFIQSYIQYGYMTMVSGIITLILVTIYYFYPSMILYRIHMTSIIITLSILFIGAVGAISGNTLIKGKKILYTTITDDPTQVIMYFIPIYNTYLRYKEHNFTQSNRRLKESILLRSIWSILGIVTQNQGLLIIVFFLIIARIVSLASGIDITNTKVKDLIDKTFQVNPEECRAYVIATIDYISQQIQGKMIQPSRKELILGYKKIYSHLEPSSYELMIEYSIGAIIMGRWLIGMQNTFYTRILYAPIVLIVGRYAIMYIKWKHLPPLPIAREIKYTIKKIYTNIKNKFYPA